MEVQEEFITLSALICEPTRATMLWHLLDNRAYTAGELAIVADVSATSASNHLTKLTEADLVKAEKQGRHKYFSFSRPEVAYAVESLANLASCNAKSVMQKSREVSGIKHCRTCYDHLAGFAGVKIAEALETKEVINQSGGVYNVTEKGWDWLNEFGISKNHLVKNRRPITRQCLDWSERRPHLAGQLGALMLTKMLEKNWFKKIRFSRELVVTSKGSNEIYTLLNVQV